MQKNRIASQDIIDFSIVAKKNLTPFRLNHTDEKILHLFANDNKEVDLNFLPTIKLIAEKIGKSDRSVNRSLNKLESYEIIIRLSRKTKSYGHINDYLVTSRFKQLLEKAKEKETALKEIESLERIKKCGRVEGIFSTAYGFESDEILNQISEIDRGVTTKCRTNNIKTINKNIIINLCHSDKLVDHKIIKSHLDSQTDNDFGTKIEIDHDLHKSSENYTSDVMIDFSTDDYYLADDMLTTDSQGVVLKEDSKFFYARSSSDNGTFEFASPQKTLVISNEIPLPDDFSLDHESYSYAKTIKKLNEKQIKESVTIFFNYNKRMGNTSRNWQKSYRTWLKQYDPNKKPLSHYKAKDEIKSIVPEDGRSDNYWSYYEKTSTPDSIKQREDAIAEFRRQRERLRQQGWGN